MEMVTKTRSRVSSRTIIMVLLVVIGAAVGAVVYNLATIALPTQAGAGKWEFVYGTGRDSKAAYQNLLSAVRAGADVKVQFGGEVWVWCSRVSLHPPVEGQLQDIVCDTPTHMTYQLTGPAAVQQSWFIFSHYEAGGQQTTVNEQFLFNFEDGHVEVQVNNFSSPLKWYVSK